MKINRTWMAIRKRAEGMTHSSSFKIAGIDMSYRSTGVCIAKSEQSSFTIEATTLVTNPELMLGFHGMRIASKNFNHSMIELDDMTKDCDILVIEVPSYSQNAKSAIVSGMCWMAAIDFENPLLVEPSALKIWSESKRGERKNKVKEVVVGRTGFNYTNDNVIDAIGLALLFHDEVNKLRHEHAQAYSR